MLQGMCQHFPGPEGARWERLHLETHTGAKNPQTEEAGMDFKCKKIGEGVQNRENLRAEGSQHGNLRDYKRASFRRETAQHLLGPVGALPSARPSDSKETPQPNQNHSSSSSSPTSSIYPRLCATRTKCGSRWAEQVRAGAGPTLAPQLPAT